MSILHLSSLSLTMAVAVFSLGYATPLQAQNQCFPEEFCDRDGDAFVKDHKRCAPAICGLPIDCDDSDDEANLECADTGDSQSTFNVTMRMSSADTPMAANCNDGTTDKGLDANFGDSGCPILLDDEEYGPGPFCFCTADVRTTGQGTDVLLFFHLPCGASHCGPDTWVSKRLPATIGPGPSGSAFKITVDEPIEGVVLEKNHQPDKATTLEDTSVDVIEMVYTIADP